MADQFYGATLNISAARNAVNTPNFNCFIFQVYGSGNGSYYLNCSAEYGTPPTQTYVHQTVTATTNPPWSNPPGSHFFTFCNLIIDSALFGELAPPNVLSSVITILPNGLLRELYTDYYYLSYQASTDVPGGHEKVIITKNLKPSPPY